ncbi:MULTISPECIES: DsbA family protein [unclassified Bradyrhizobium]|uniref:DsbA family protein n=1 Tax=unclassified Bradyrhizobium TaxID=2631580 RepID=UPI0024786D08|nr:MULTISPECIES: DsbA family protein [unclassified Bradyrhizobium]WGS21083.1 DsbA family protein [Bradyrhizobium sp. ISRA463]WGS28000.1 DsbA family protein [Bradyrhizobium sp. ISRA464]
MVDRPMVRRIMILAILPAFVLGVGGMHFTNSVKLLLANRAAAAEMPQDEFEQRVKNYLLAHPEVIGEALSRLEAKRGEQDAAEGKAALKAHASEVFQDPDSPIGGNPNGDVTLVEFFDYNCPYCKMMAPLMEKAAEADPKLRIVYKEFPILGEGSVYAAKAALAANKQGKYEALHRALYQVRGAVAEAKVLEVARAVGLDVERLKADMQDKAIESMLDKNVKLGEALHITGTPGFVAGEQVSTGARDLSSLQAFVAQARNDPRSVK